MELSQKWPGYRGKGRPLRTIQRGVPTLPPLTAVLQPGATINRNGDAPALVIERAQVQIRELTGKLDLARTAAERRRLAKLRTTFERLILYMEHRAC